MQQAIKRFLPMSLKTVIKQLSGKSAQTVVHYYGNYLSWSEAREDATGYDATEILAKVKKSALKVRDGDAIYERDTCLFYKQQYSWPLLAALLRIAAAHGNRLNLLDFGGSLGSTYYQHRDFLADLYELKWNIVEQHHFVQCGNQYFKNYQLDFYDEIEECVIKSGANVLLASGSIQYLEKPWATVEKIVECGFEYILVDRLGIIEGEEHRLTVEIVPPGIYKGSYPVWFFNHSKFIQLFDSRYKVITEFDSYCDPPTQVGGQKVFWIGMLLKKVKATPE